MPLYIEPPIVLRAADPQPRVNGLHIYETVAFGINELENIGLARPAPQPQLYRYCEYGMLPMPNMVSRKRIRLAIYFAYLAKTSPRLNMAGLPLFRIEDVIKENYHAR